MICLGIHQMVYSACNRSIMLKHQNIHRYIGTQNTRWHNRTGYWATWHDGWNVNNVTGQKIIAEYRFGLKHTDLLKMKRVFVCFILTKMRDLILQITGVIVLKVYCCKHICDAEVAFNIPGIMIQVPTSICYIRQLIKLCDK